MGLEGGCKSTPNNKPPRFVERERRNRSLRILRIGFMRHWTRHIPMSQTIVMNGPLWLGCHKWSVIDGPSRVSCHQHTSDSDQTSYSGMVVRTICEDSVLNHRSKLSWMKRQSTNCQRQVAIDIFTNVPPWMNHHNHIATGGCVFAVSRHARDLRAIRVTARERSKPSNCERAIHDE